MIFKIYQVIAASWSSTQTDIKSPAPIEITKSLSEYESTEDMTLDWFLKHEGGRQACPFQPSWVWEEGQGEGQKKGEEAGTEAHASNLPSLR